MIDSPDEAKRYSLKLLGYRGRSESELRKRLDKKGFSEAVVSLTVAYLKKIGYLDDAVLAANLKRQAMENKLLGLEGARSFMVRRGLPCEIIESALNYEYDEDRELKNIQKLLDKRLKSVRNYLTEGEKRKLWNFLVRRGYSFETIRKAMKEVKLGEETE